MINQLRKISLIHAIKCAKASKTEVAMQSFSKLDSFKNRISDEEDVNQEVLEWMQENPTVNDTEIRNLNGK